MFPSINGIGKNILFIVLFIVLIIPKGNTQFSVQAGYLDMGPNDWEDVTLEDFHRNGFAVGLEYWFRLKKYRVEFFPGIWYNHRQEYTVDVLSLPDQGDFIHASNYFSLQLATTFYPLDFEGDCNCPTFSKQGNLIKKGFFLQVVPELGLFNGTTNTVTIAGPVETTSSSYLFAMGIGAGLDIGITDLITISPIFRLTYYPSVDWEDFSAGGELGTSSFLAKQFGIRLSFRPDYLKETGRFRRR